MSHWSARTASGLVLIGLAPLLNGRIQGTNGAAPTTFEGSEARDVAFVGLVLEPGGAPAEGAVVVSSAGGQAVVDRHGNYRLEVRVPLEARSVHLTAVGGSGGNLVARTSVALAVGLAQVAPLRLAASSPGQPSWLPTFGGAPGIDEFIEALAVFDDGSGPALYAGGGFTMAGGVPANYVAKWNGWSWAPLGEGLDGNVHALTVFDDGTGPALYAGGDFEVAGSGQANHIAKWDGSNWHALLAGLRGPAPTVFALTVFDDGTGPALFVGGIFNRAGLINANRIAKWDGTTWSALDEGVRGTGANVFCLRVFDDGGGPALYVGGHFTMVGLINASRIAKWDGADWSALGSGLSSYPYALEVFDDGSGPALYAGGAFVTAGGVTVNQVAKWDGSSWSALDGGTDGVVYGLRVYDDGQGPALYAAGAFPNAGGVPVNGIGKWDGASWSALENGPAFLVERMAVFDDGSGPVLAVAGIFTTVGGVPVDRIAKWNGSSWAPLGPGLDGSITALETFDDGQGPALYAAGTLSAAEGKALGGIGRWDGSSWTPLDDGLDERAVALTVFDDGSGPALYAGGHFSEAGGLAANRIAQWDGSNWTPLGSGMNGAVLALTVFDDGSGAALYAGGNFTTAGGNQALRVARWNGSSWTALGCGTSGAISALAVFDDGGGPALYAGGGFATAGGTAAPGIARWNGSSWAALGTGITPQVQALAVFDDGSGAALYAGGDFDTAGGVAAARIAKWNGSSWTALAGGVGGGSVDALKVFDDGFGPALYAGGDFATADGVAANRIAKWDDSSWTPLGRGLDPLAVSALAVFNDRTGPALYAGGDFGSAPDSGDSYLAKWGSVDTTAPTITCPAPIVRDDRPGTPGEIVNFTVTAFDAEDPTPTIVCTPPSGSRFPRGKTLVICTATDFSGNQATCEFTVTLTFKAH